MNIQTKWETILKHIKASVSIDSYRNVSESIGINYTTLWRLIKENRVPSIDLVIQIEKWYDSLP